MSDFRCSTDGESLSKCGRPWMSEDEWMSVNERLWMSDRQLMSECGWRSWIYHNWIRAMVLAMMGVKRREGEGTVFEIIEWWCVAMQWIGWTVKRRVIEIALWLSVKPSCGDMLVIRKVTENSGQWRDEVSGSDNKMQKTANDGLRGANSNARKSIDLKNK